MMMATLVLRRVDAGVRAPPTELVEDALWAHIKLDDRIEHIRAGVEQNAIAICFFVRCRERAVANAIVHDIEYRIRTIPTLRGWSRV